MSANDARGVEIPEDLREMHRQCVEFLAHPGEPYAKPIEWCVHLIERIAALTAQNDRLMDLVRHQRHALYDEKLISNEEFAALVADSESGQRVARLETYDRLTAQVALLEKRVSVLTRALASTDSARQKFLDERDLLEKRCEALDGNALKIWWHERARPIIDAIGEISVQEAMDAIERDL